MCWTQPRLPSGCLPTRKTRDLIGEEGYVMVQRPALEAAEKEEPTVPERRSKRPPLSEAHARLGEELQRLREGAGVKNRDIPGFSTGQVSNVESGCTAPSRDFVDTYIRLFGEGARIEALYEQMRRTAERKKQEQLRSRRSNAREPSRPPQSLDEVSTREDVMKHIAVEAHEAYCILGSAGAIEEMWSVISIRAKSPSVRLYYAGHFYDADPRPGVLELSAVAGASLAGVRESEVGALKSYFLLDRPLEPDEPEPYVFSYRVRVRSAKRAQSQLAFYSLPGTLRMTLRAQFTAPSKPQKLWWVAAPNMVNLEHEPDHELLPLEDDVYYREFGRLVPNWCYGFSWLWPD